mgnify:CR=1 FL=1
MKKIIYLIIIFFFSSYIYACAGYKPIFSSSNLQFKIINHSIEGDKNIKSINLINDEGKIEKIETDYVLGFFGLIMKLGPIANWGLNLDKKKNSS